MDLDNNIELLATPQAAPATPIAPRAIEKQPTRKRARFEAAFSPILVPTPAPLRRNEPSKGAIAYQQLYLALQAVK